MVKYFHESMKKSTTPGFVKWRRDNTTQPKPEYRQERPTVTPDIIKKLASTGTNVEIVDFMCDAIRPMVTGGTKVGGKRIMLDRMEYAPLAQPVEALPSRDFSLLKHKREIGYTEGDCEAYAEAFRQLVKNEKPEGVYQRMLESKDSGKQHSHEWNDYIYKQFSKTVARETNLVDDENELLEYKDESPKLYAGSDVSIGEYTIKHLIPDFGEKRVRKANQKGRKDPDIIIKSYLQIGEGNFDIYALGEMKAVSDFGGAQDSAINDAISLTELTQSNDHRCVICLAVIDGAFWDGLYKDSQKPKHSQRLKTLSEAGIIHPCFLKPCMDEVIKTIKASLVASQQ